MNLKAHVTTTLQKGIRRVAVVAYTSRHNNSLEGLERVAVVAYTSPCTTQFVREETMARSFTSASTILAHVTTTLQKG